MTKNHSLRLTMLGTGHAMVTRCYNTCFVLGENGEYFMVDAGGGNQILRILEQQNISLSQIHDLFVTHAHSDHILGAVWIIRAIGQQINHCAYSGTLNVYAHGKIIEQLQTICSIVVSSEVTALFGSRIRFLGLQDGDCHTILRRSVTFFDIQSTKLLQYGFRIDEERLLFCGDEPLKEALRPCARDIKYLLHEAFCLESEKEAFQPHEKHHSTVKDVCCMAEELHVETLVLMHTEDEHIADRKKLYTAEGKAFFSGNLLVPDDGESIHLN